jgi:diguanylate cyclase (GGDEF)-like protein
MRNLLDLKYSETSALLMALLVFQLLSYIGWGLYNVYHPVYQHFVNVDFIWQMFWVYLGATMIGLAWLGVCLYHRHDPKWQIPLSIGAVGIFLIVMLSAGFVSGLLAMSLGVVLAGGPMLGILMLPSRIVLVAVGIAGVVLGCLTYASVSGYLPYAPLFKEQLISSSPEYGLFYFWSEVYFVIPFLIVIMIVANQFLTQWREREAKIRHMSQTDALTELFNRRTAHENLTNLLARPNQHPVSAILLDLDHFKRINDVYGHLVGDQALKQTAAALKRSLRTDDVIARFGGEEFLIVLDGVTCATAKNVAERCRRMLMEIQILDKDGNRIPVTGSFGVACMLSGLNVVVDDLLREADEALYVAKSEGRNRVVNHRCPNEQLSLTHPTARRAHRITRAGQLPAAS